MATENANQTQNEGFFAAAAATIRAAQQAVNDRIEVVTAPLMADGTLAAAFRQGADELYEALKPFPQSIQVHEPGTLLNPTQGEIAADRRPDPPTLSEIAASRPSASTELDSGKQNELQNQKEMGMSM
ncbi:hypothetical protein [Paludisphaera borealis]|uniref:Uncharacterized protein n=1 Tax=Paludisphaera borealis TaxID=1387353 RepID=A0A1U7CI83_9BACT|nr:hypothetical protein [Paludisphaera borealis]APW58639.1 hypothetical protein BSF38_00037 [Paludisphaera borealis]